MVNRHCASAATVADRRRADNKRDGDLHPHHEALLWVSPVGSRTKKPISWQILIFIAFTLFSVITQIPWLTTISQKNLTIHHLKTTIPSIWTGIAAIYTAIALNGLFHTLIYSATASILNYYFLFKNPSNALSTLIALLIALPATSLLAALFSLLFAKIQNRPKLTHKITLHSHIIILAKIIAVFFLQFQTEITLHAITPNSKIQVTLAKTLFSVNYNSIVRPQVYLWEIPILIAILLPSILHAIYSSFIYAFVTKPQYYPLVDLPLVHSYTWMARLSFHWTLLIVCAGNAYHSNHLESWMLTVIVIFISALRTLIITFGLARQSTRSARLFTALLLMSPFCSVQEYIDRHGSVAVKQQQTATPVASSTGGLEKRPASFNTTPATDIPPDTPSAASVELKLPSTSVTGSDIDNSNSCTERGVRIPFGFSMECRLLGVNDAESNAFLELLSVSSAFLLVITWSLLAEFLPTTVPVSTFQLPSSLLLPILQPFCVFCSILVVIFPFLITRRARYYTPVVDKYTKFLQARFTSGNNRPATTTITPPVLEAPPEILHSEGNDDDGPPIPTDTEDDNSVLSLESALCGSSLDEFSSISSANSEIEEYALSSPFSPFLAAPSPHSVAHKAVFTLGRNFHSVRAGSLNDAVASPTARRILRNLVLVEPEPVHFQSPPPPPPLVPVLKTSKPLVNGLLTYGYYQGDDDYHHCHHSMFTSPSASLLCLSPPSIPSLKPEWNFLTKPYQVSACPMQFRPQGVSTSDSIGAVSPSPPALISFKDDDGEEEEDERFFSRRSAGVPVAYEVAGPVDFDDQESFCGSIAHFGDETSPPPGRRRITVVENSPVHAVMSPAADGIQEDNGDDTGRRIDKITKRIVDHFMEFNLDDDVVGEQVENLGCKDEERGSSSSSNSSSYLVVKSNDEGSSGVSGCCGGSVGMMEAVVDLTSPVRVPQGVANIVLSSPTSLDKRQRQHHEYQSPIGTTTSMMITPQQQRHRNNNNNNASVVPLATFECASRGVVLDDVSRREYDPETGQETAESCLRRAIDPRAYNSISRDTGNSGRKWAAPSSPVDNNNNNGLPLEADYGSFLKLGRLLTVATYGRLASGGELSIDMRVKLLRAHCRVSSSVGGWFRQGVFYILVNARWMIPVCLVYGCMVGCSFVGMDEDYLIHPETKQESLEYIFKPII